MDGGLFLFSKTKGKKKLLKEVKHCCREIDQNRKVREEERNENHIIRHTA
jgi:hypothetical protein